MSNVAAKQPKGPYMFNYQGQGTYGATNSLMSQDATRNAEGTTPVFNRAAVAPVQSAAVDNTKLVTDKTFASTNSDTGNTTVNTGGDANALQYQTGRQRRGAASQRLQPLLG